MRTEMPGEMQFTRSVTSLLVSSPACAAASFDALTVARFVTSGHAASVASTVWTEVLEPPARSPRSQVTACPLVEHPLETFTMVRPSGIVSCTTTSFAVAPPTLSTVTVYVKRSPGVTPPVGASELLRIETSGFGQTTSTFTVLLALFPVWAFASFEALTVAWFDTSGHDASVVLTVTDADALAPLARSPRSHVTVWPFVEHPFDTEVIVRLGSNESLIWTSLAVESPTFDAVRVYVTESPELTLVELALFVTLTSGVLGQLTSTVTVLLSSLPLWEAGSFEALTVAWFDTEGQEESVVLAVICTESLAPLARSPRSQVTVRPFVEQ